MGDLPPLVDESVGSDPSEENRLLQACTFIEDAIHFRLTYHRVDSRSLKVYRLYHANAVQWSVSCVLMVLHLLIFFEAPSSLSESADVRQCKGDLFEDCRVIVPSTVLLSLEGLCLALLTIDCLVKVYSFGIRQIRYYPWHLAYGTCLVASVIGWLLAILIPCCSSWPVCGNACKWRCLLRPVFLIQHSSIIKKALKCLVKALPSILSVLLLLFLHILLFTLIGLALFPSGKGPAQYNAESAEGSVYFASASKAFVNMFILLTTSNNPTIMTAAYNENRFYSLFFIIYVGIGIYCFLYILLAVVFQQFRDYFKESLRNRVLRRRAGLVSAFQVLSDVDLTTGRRHVPASRISVVIFNLNVIKETKDRLYQRFMDELKHIQQVHATLESNEGGSEASSSRDILDVNISWKQFFKKIFAIGISDQRRNAYINNMKRRFHSNMGNIQEVSENNFEDNILNSERSGFKKMLLEFLDVVLSALRLLLSSNYFIHFGTVANVVNVILITIQTSNDSRKVSLEIPSLVFACYYVVEQIGIIWACRPRVYIGKWLHRLDFFFTFLISLSTVIYLCVDSLTAEDYLVSRYATVGITHILMGCRLVRAVLSLMLPHLIVRTMADLLINLTPFLGLLMAQYYFFAVIGMMVFSGTIEYHPNAENCWKWDNSSDSCKPPFPNISTVCPYGDGYHSSEFWAQNFNDFASSIVVLWNLMVVNDWQTLLQAFTNATNEAAQLFFILWYILTVLVSLDLFIAVVVENFNTRWSAYTEEQQFQRRQEKIMTDAASGRLPSKKQSHVSNRSAKRTDGRNYVRTQSQPMPLAYILGVDAPNMELVREHLASNPFSFSDYTDCPDDFLTIYDTDSEDDFDNTITSNTFFPTVDDQQNTSEIA